MLPLHLSSNRAIILLHKIARIADLAVYVSLLEHVIFEAFGFDEDLRMSLDPDLGPLEGRYSIRRPVGYLYAQHLDR
jgi:hypothetical protein